MKKKICNLGDNFKLANIEIFIYIFAEMLPKFTEVKWNDSSKKKVKVS